ncbi:MAG: hypothetical protein JKY31_04000 [Rhodobacteraceae bacterium]|nr:hypothetical protein [Paracoccaceae bacterium]
MKGMDRLGELAKGLEYSLKKLTLSSYPTEDVMGPAANKMAAMYNPSTIDLSYGLDYHRRDHINNRIINPNVIRINPGQLQLELIFDATLPGNTDSVNEQLTQLRELTTFNKGEDTGIPYLKISWGNMQWHGKDYFKGQLESLSIRYSLFDRDANPIRATASLTLVCQDNVSSNSHPDLTSNTPSVTAAVGSTLAMIAANLAAVGAVYGLDYLSVAEDNDMDNLDDYEAGDTLVSNSDEEQA